MDTVKGPITNNTQYEAAKKEVKKIPDRKRGISVHYKMRMRQLTIEEERQGNCSKDGR